MHDFDENTPYGWQCSKQCQSQEFNQKCFMMISCVSDFHKNAPYVVSGSVDQSVKVWECR